MPLIVTYWYLVQVFNTMHLAEAKNCAAYCVHVFSSPKQFEMETDQHNELFSLVRDKQTKPEWRVPMLWRNRFINYLPTFVLSGPSPASHLPCFAMPYADTFIYNVHIKEIRYKDSSCRSLHSLLSLKFKEVLTKIKRSRSAACLFLSRRIENAITQWRTEHHYRIYYKVKAAIEIPTTAFFILKPKGHCNTLILDA